VPLYLAHATDDPVVPAAQSVALAAELAAAHGLGRSFLELSPTGGHTWPYWGAALRRALPWLVQRRRR
jgi:S-formylglutathione hydrolase FrmB